MDLDFETDWLADFKYDGEIITYDGSFFGDEDPKFQELWKELGMDDVLLVEPEPKIEVRKRSSIEDLNQKLSKPVNLDFKPTSSSSVKPGTEPKAPPKLASLKDRAPQKSPVEDIRVDRRQAIQKLKTTNSDNTVSAKLFGKSNFEKEINEPLSHYLDQVDECLKNGIYVPTPKMVKQSQMLQRRIQDEINEQEKSEQKSKKQKEIDYHKSKKESAQSLANVLRTANAQLVSMQMEISAKSKEQLESTGELDCLRTIISDFETFSKNKAEASEYLQNADKNTRHAIIFEVLQGENIGVEQVFHLEQLFHSINKGVDSLGSFYSALRDRPKLLLEVFQESVKKEITKTAKTGKAQSPMREHDLASKISSKAFELNARNWLDNTLGDDLLKSRKDKGPPPPSKVYIEDLEDIDALFLKQFPELINEYSAKTFNISKETKRAKPLQKVADTYAKKLEEMVASMCDLKKSALLPEIFTCFTKMIRTQSEDHYGKDAEIVDTLMATTLFRVVGASLQIRCKNKFLPTLVKSTIQGTSLSGGMSSPSYLVFDQLGLGETIEKLRKKYVVPFFAEVLKLGEEAYKKLSQDDGGKTLSTPQGVLEISKLRGRKFLAELRKKLDKDKETLTLGLTKELGHYLFSALDDVDKKLDEILLLTTKMGKSKLKSLIVAAAREVQLEHSKKILGDIPKDYYELLLSGYDPEMEKLAKKEYEESGVSEKQKDYLLEIGVNAKWDEVPRDGNCLFHCLVLAGIGKDHKAMRLKLAKDIQTNKTLKPFITDMQAAVREISKSGAYVGEAAFMTEYIAETEKLEITIVEADGSTRVVGKGSKTVTLARNHNHYWHLNRKGK